MGNYQSFPSKRVTSLNFDIALTDKNGDDKNNPISLWYK